MTVPDHVPPKKVETAPGAAPVEVRHVARAEDLREGTEADDWVLTLLVGVLHAVRKEAFNLRWLPEISPVAGRDGLNRILGGNIAVEVEDLCLELDDADGSDWKPLWRDGRVDPVIAGVSHHVLKRLAVVDGNDAGTDRISAHRTAPVALTMADVCHAADRTNEMPVLL